MNKKKIKTVSIDCFFCSIGIVSIAFLFFRYRIDIMLCLSVLHRTRFRHRYPISDRSDTNLQFPSILQAAVEVPLLLWREPVEPISISRRGKRNGCFFRPSTNLASAVGSVRGAARVCKRRRRLSESLKSGQSV